MPETKRHLEIRTALFTISHTRPVTVPQETSWGAVANENARWYRLRHPSRDAKRSRVFLVVSRNTLVESRFATVICAPVYTERRGISTEVAVGAEEGLKHASSILCDALVSVDKARLTDYVGALSRQKLGELRAALRAAVDVE